MTRETRRKLILVLMIAALFGNPNPQLACGPFFERAVFTFKVHPDFPLEKFAAGELGVLQPTYARSYLAVAYRYFAGIGLDPQAQKAVRSLWEERLNLDGGTSATGIAAWLDARSKTPDVIAPGNIEAVRSENRPGYTFGYLNCPADAFRTAAGTLDRLIREFGAASPQVKEWVQAQDQVFANCSGDLTIPAPPNSDAPPLLQAERNYQIAAANFYAGRFDTAEQMFAQIAADTSSPWQTHALYLTARTCVRKATLTAGENKVDKAALAQAQEQLRRVLGDASQSQVHPAAARLVSFVRFRLEPEARLHELAQALLEENPGEAIYQVLYDYTALLDKYAHDDEEERTFEKLPRAVREDDLTDWVLTFQVLDPAALDYSLKKYAATSSLAWLVAAISKIGGSNPQTPALIEAAAQVPAASPAFATVSLHRLRLLVASGNKAEARSQLDALLASGKPTLPISALNQLLSLRTQLADNLDDFLKYGQRAASGLTADLDGREIPEDPNQDQENMLLKEIASGRVMFDVDSTKILNQQMPLSVLKDTALNPILAVHLRRQVALAVWVRSVLLDKEETARAMVAELQQGLPEIKGLLAEYSAANSPDAKKFAAINLMLKFPGTRPVVDAGVARTEPLGELESYGDNWWRSFAEVAGSANVPPSKEAKPSAKDPKAVFPDFLTESQKDMATKEWQKLATLDTAPNYLCAQAVRWAKLKPEDPRVPEALHLAVRSTRYGHTNSNTGKFSKEAYDLLHRKYPKSPWAAKTKYWYKG